MPPDIIETTSNTSRKRPQAVIEPLAVHTRDACALLQCGHTFLYTLLEAGELDSYRDGRLRKVTTASIREYVQRRAKKGLGRPKRGRPRKHQTKKDG